MSNNKKLIAILIACFLIIIILTTKVIIPCVKEIQEQEKIKNAKVIVDLKKDNKVSFYSDKKLSELIDNINGELIDDLILETKEIGNKKLTFEYKNEENIKIPFTIEYEVVDNTPPIVWIGNSYSVNIGTSEDFYKNIMCGDDLDDYPICKIEGNYNLNKAGSYNVEFIASDYSGNVTSKPFTLYVKDPNKVSSSNNQNTETIPVVNRTYFEDIKKQYKNEKTKIGIDVSRYQGDIDFETLKEAGVEFAILRVGGTLGIEADYFLDAKFKQNVEGFKRVGIPIGIYFFSYAPSKEAAIKDAEWVYEQIKDYDIELPVVYDWENWSFYNEFNLSFSKLTKNAEAFLDTLKMKGYDGMLYSSKNYLEQIWLKTDYPIWIAHYTKDPNINYEQYHYWQICDNGQVDGITGNVDIDIMYIKE